MAVLRVLHQHFIIFSLFPLYHNKAQMTLAMKLRSTYGVSSKLDRRVEIFQEPAKRTAILIVRCLNGILNFGYSIGYLVLDVWILLPAQYTVNKIYHHYRLAEPISMSNGFIFVQSEEVA